MQTDAANNTETEPFIGIDEALRIMPGFTKAHLAQLRYLGNGPRFYKPTPRTVLYRRSEIIAWLDASARTSTAED